ncbi:unnamed protein product [Notodromas monacha]|uniref:PCI domain-containing protein n=1 Tax=Notodromas monacha TaxID=399045 RepID=A0A7R9BET8_9CRUS|nr:unnamed protein product [Notodromas monacha]CAG0913356.1 unnamed protein product [Notodromas monacha]
MVASDVEDVEMKSVDGEGVREAAGAETKDADALTLEDIREHARLLEKSVASKEPRFAMRVLRTLPTTRRRLNPAVVRRLIEGFYTHSPAERDNLLKFAGGRVTDETNEATFKPLRNLKHTASPLLPEVDVYLNLLVLLRALDSGDHALAADCSDALMDKVVSLDRRTLDAISAKCYFYHARCYELTNKLATIRNFLHRRLRTCTLRNDFEGQAVLLNCLLRNYLSQSLYDQADKLVSKCQFPPSASNNELARYMYYLGRIKAIQLEYSAAQRHLTQALRKAPQHAAVGFKQTVQKMLVTVELLLGEIPDRQTFRQNHMRKALGPYFELTLALKTGNLQGFSDTLSAHGAKFQRDDTYTLIVRLHRNVVKTAIRMIASAYSRIPLRDVAAKLMLDSPEDAEFVVAKAIRDNVIEAVINHDEGYVQSKDVQDLYCTKEPQQAFHHRISFCLDIHNQSVKALRFPPKSYHKDLEESAAERREREQQDLEYAKELAEDDDEY